MGLFQRIFKVGESQAHSLVDKLEDPIKMTEQGIRDLKNDLQKAMTSLAQVKAIAIRHKKDAEDQKKQAADYERKAMMLLQKMQGGDIDHMNGKGGKSIYGTRFEDENFRIPHSGPGMVSMANCGKNTNGSQFFIITAEGGTKHLDGKHVVFGRVIQGMELVYRMEALGSDEGRPQKRVQVIDCGEMKLSPNQNALLHGDADSYNDTDTNYESNKRDLLSLSDFESTY